MPEPTNSEIAFAEEGLTLFEKLGREKVLALAAEVPDAVSHPLDATDAARRFEITEDEAGTALTTLTWLAMRPDPEEALAGFEKSEGRAIALAAADYLRKEPLKTEIDQSVARAHLANRVLPSLRAVDVAVDARVDFGDDEVVVSVPVALVAILTDTAEPVSFQMTKKQVRILQKQLTETLQQMEAVEKWVTR